MPDQLGDFIWYELLTSDADAAQDFYGELIGWKFADSGYPGVDYRMFSADGPPVGGLMGITAEMAEGGSVMMPAMDMDDIGRMAMVADPQGAIFSLIGKQTEA